MPVIALSQQYHATTSVDQQSLIKQNIGATPESRLMGTISVMQFYM